MTVAVGRALVVEPKIFVLDEPLSHLDPMSRRKVRDALKRLHGEMHTTTLYVTHNLPEAMALGDMRAVLDQGRIQQIGPPRDVYRRPANDFVKASIHSVDLPVYPS